MIVVDNRRSSGFSLIELLMVVILLGILSIFALGRLGNQDAFAARGFFDDIVGAVRFAQKLAVSTGCDVRVVLTANSYQLLQSSICTANDFTLPVANPADRSSAYQSNAMPPGYSLNPTPNIITFNARGERVGGGPPTFSLSDGAVTFSFTVHAGTGLVEVL